MGVALETTNRASHLVEGNLAVMPKRRMSKVMRQRRRIDDLGITTQALAKLTGNLRNLKRMGQPVPNKIVGARTHHLGFTRQSAQGRRVQNPRAVALECGSTGPLLRFGDESLFGFFRVGLHAATLATDGD